MKVTARIAVTAKRDFISVCIVLWFLWCCLEDLSTVLEIKLMHPDQATTLL